MQGDPRSPRFFADLNLFVFFMLTLVLADNFLLLYLGWEGVGLCSYLLIGFWFERRAAAFAAKKAFIVTRIGDSAFLIGIVFIWLKFHSLAFATVFGRAHGLASGTATIIALLLFAGACGKSAQLPLHVWLPDAMEGPTPVSALIHAATMVTAGVYMVARSHTLFERSGVALEVVAIVGTVTAVFAASIGLVQTDIKRVLAYSTISQLGYMFAAVGLGAYAAGIFHLVTHAFFKALLFLGAGSVIHGMGGEQDLRKLGGLTFLAGWAVGMPSETGTRFARFLTPVFPPAAHEWSGAVTLMLAVLSTSAASAGIVLAWFRYAAAPVKAATIGQPRTPFHKLLLNAYYVDLIYDRLIVRPLYVLSVFLAYRVDLGIIDGLVNAVGRAVVAWAAGFRRLQTGYVVNYALTMLVGAVLLVGFLLIR